MSGHVTGSSPRSRVTDQRRLLRALGLGSRSIGRRGAAVVRARVRRAHADQSIAHWWIIERAHCDRRRGWRCCSHRTAVAIGVGLHSGPPCSASASDEWCGGGLQLRSGCSTVLVWIHVRPILIAVYLFCNEQFIRAKHNSLANDQLFPALYNTKLSDTQLTVYYYNIRLSQRRYVDITFKKMNILW